MMMIILIGIALAIGIYFYMQNLKQKNQKKNELKSFIPSKTFIGAKKGYIFKNDNNGIGYYLDRKINY